MTGVTNLRRGSIAVMCVIGAYAVFMFVWFYSLKLDALWGVLGGIESGRYDRFGRFVLSSPFDLIAFGLFIAAWLIVGFTPKQRKDAAER